MVTEANRLATIGYKNLNERDKIIFNSLAEKLTKEKEAAQLEEKRKNNVQSRPPMESGLKAKRSYSDSTNRIGGKAWKNNVGGNGYEYRV